MNWYRRNPELPCKIHSLQDWDADDLEELTGEDYYDLLREAETLFKDGGINLSSSEELFAGCIDSSGKVLGVSAAGMYHSDDGVTIRFSLAVKEDSRRQGIARALLKDILSSEFSDEPVIFEGWVVNPHMVTLLEEFGFEADSAGWSLNRPFMEFRPNPDVCDFCQQGSIVIQCPCGKNSCIECSAHCGDADCDYQKCPKCVEKCGCGKGICPNHNTFCELCQKTYCVFCTGYCDDCGQIVCLQHLKKVVGDPNVDDFDDEYSCAVCIIARGG
jgi:ribosomal protein S18 acetylase RimI-like enzyme